MKEYQEPEIIVIKFEVSDVVSTELDSSDLGEWD